MPATYNLSGFNAYADRQIQSGLHSGLFQVSPLLSILAGKSVTEGMIGRPGTTTILGRGSVKRVPNERLSGSLEGHVRFLTGKVGGTKNLGERDTAPSTGNDSQDQKVRSAYFRWTLKQTPILVWNNTLRLAGSNKFRIANAVKEATELAMEEHLEDLHQELFTGNPSDQTADVWDATPGLEQAIDDNNTYGAVDRGTYTTWQAKVVSTAKTASLRLIDDANLTQGIRKTGPGVDVVLTTFTLFDKFKQEALARGGTHIVSGTPDASEVGQIKEAVKYNGVLIVPDPKATASYVYMLTLADWLFQINGDDNFRVTSFKDLSDDPGGKDAVAAKISTMYRLMCLRPWNQILYTSVS